MINLSSPGNAGLKRSRFTTEQALLRSLKVSVFDLCQREHSRTTASSSFLVTSSFLLLVAMPGTPSLLPPWFQRGFTAMQVVQQCRQSLTASRPTLFGAPCGGLKPGTDAWDEGGKDKRTKEGFYVEMVEMGVLVCGLQTGRRISPTRNH